ncbi:uncharacterized protein LOC123510024 isoform X2 [Portunus trituberculatus]|uniref:uncharacterized protein LOC123510024 isoform X2 n=1 Tax=Portunus trituberculatus TaxID=210409 RepID=UPI001E1D0E44|nr:uncharacterized protein LOC123510024 isoform X2 [Portunus trituberculatus]
MDYPILFDLYDEPKAGRGEKPATMFLWRLRCAASWRGATLTLLLLSIANCFFSYYTYLNSRLPFDLPAVQSDDCIITRRELARRVMRVQRQVETLRGNKGGGVLSPIMAHELRAIARELDPRITSEKDQKTAVVSKGYVCQEVYRGKEADLSFYHNFMQVECDDAPPFREVLTVILSTKGWMQDRVATVVHNLKKHYDVDVVVLTYDSDYGLGPLSVEGVSVQAWSPDTTTSSAINKAVASVKTPFVLLSDSLTHFSGELCSLERLVRVLDQEGETAAAAAGSYRISDGTWTHGCLQRRLENYQLAYVSGYEHSRHECMFCDDILGPFVARTNTLQQVPLTDSLDGSVSMRDWFINLYIAGHFAVACPDVMFFVDEAPLMAHQDWKEVATAWAVQYVWPHDGEKHEFTCEEVKMECVNIMKMVSSFLVPPCCREALRRELGLVQECGEELGLYVELQDGSLLGAVKTDGILPWDFDMDVLGDCKDQEVWMKQGTACMGRKGCSSVLVQGTYWMTTCNVSFVDVSCRPDRLKRLPPEYRKFPTKVNYNGRMINVPPNPALVSRNHYGPEYLRHEVHWRYTGKDKRLWNRCFKSGFHACLENFPTDGNIKFMDFPHQLVGL